MGWLADMIDGVSADADLDPATLQLDGDTIREILELTRIAAHTSGERFNAPLLAFALGRAVERGASLEVLAAAVRRLADEVPADG